MTATPSKSPADDGTLQGTFRLAFRKVLQQTDGMLPARVVAYNRQRNVATVQPIIMVRNTEGATFPRAQLAEVPVLSYGGGGFCLSFPLVPGDFGWIESNDRDISKFIQDMTETDPNTDRLHSFEDGRFIPDVFRQYNVGQVASDAMSIQSLDGSVRIELSPSGVKIVAPDVRVESPLTTFTGDVVVNQNLQVDQSATIEVETTTAGIAFTTHRHGGVQSGGAVTLVPQ